jgi:hypothetical protein
MSVDERKRPAPSSAGWPSDVEVAIVAHDHRTLLPEALSSLAAGGCPV